MKRLLIMRHGEAQDAEIGGDDKIRQLTRKGRSDMQRLHVRLLGDGLMPEFALASDAQRTQATLKEVTGHEFSGPVAFSADLYNAKAQQIIDEAQLLDDKYRTVLIVAHNPGVYQAVLDLTMANEQQGLIKKLGNNYKSGTLTVMECPIEKWSDLKPGANRPTRVIMPDA